MKTVKRALLLALCLVTAMGVMTPRAQAVVGSKQVTIAFSNIMLIVDGKKITVLDEENKNVEIFSLDGVVYIPARTLGDVLGKAGKYNSKNTSYVIAKPEVNPLKWVSLYDRAYVSTSDANRFKAYTSGGIQYFGGEVVTFTEISKDRYQGSWDVTYPLNKAAQKASGTICVTKDGNAREAVYEFYDDNNKLLYRSPIMTKNISETKFEFNTGASKNLKLKIVLTSNWYYGGAECYIKDLKIHTTDYKK